jgi:serine/threonine protein phosphatase PrpC/serine/threonine protein kinase
MGCTTSTLDSTDDPAASRSRGYSTVASRDEVHGESTKKEKKVKDGREEAIEANFDFTHCGMVIKGAWVSRRGYYPENLNKDNQDALSFVPSFGQRHDQAFFAVYDGHGKEGHHVARYCRDNLPDNVKKSLDEKVIMRDGSNALVRGVVQVARRMSGSFVSAQSGGSAQGSSNSLNLGDIKLQRVDSSGSQRGGGSIGGGNIIYEETESSPNAGGMELNSDGSIKDVALTSKEIHDALKTAHLKTNENLKKTQSIQSTLSGTTAISVFMRDGVLYVSNVGDSRAICVSKKDGKLIIKPLSDDQTPYRKDERDRVRKTGARVMSMDQIDGLAPINDDSWGDIRLGEEIDESGDPPRVWHATEQYPGCAFTRSIGDLVAKNLGVTPEPEILERKMEITDKYYVLASDGVFEFITNKSVGEIVNGIDDPLEACREITHMAYDLWLANEVRTDDITIIILKVCSTAPNIVLEEDDSGDDDDSNSGIKLRSDSHVFTPDSDLLRLGLPSLSMKASTRPEDTWKDSHADEDSKARSVTESALNRRSTLRDYRTRLSYQIFDTAGKGGDKDGDGDAAGETESALAEAHSMVPKSDDDVQTIKSAISNNFLFQYLTEDQRKSVLDRMVPMDVKAGTVIIAQGSGGNDESNHFYVADQGRFSVSQNGTEIHVYVGDRASGRHPGFGELSLLYDKPRAASVTATTDGRLFALSREVFKDVLIYSVDARRVVVKCLRSIPRLQCLNQNKMETLAALLAKSGELKLRAGEVLLGEKESGAHFTIIVKGELDVYNKDAAVTSVTTRGSRPLRDGLVLHRGYTFGIGALSDADGRAGLEGFKIVAKTDAIALAISKRAFEAEFGDLETLQAQYQAMKSFQRRPSSVAPPSLDDVEFLGLSFADEACRISVGSFRSQIKGRANVSVMSFILSEVEAAKRIGRVKSTLEACRAITGNVFSEEYFKQSDAFLPKIINTYRHPNALHLLLDRPLICSLLSIIQNPSLDKIPLDKDLSVAYVMSSLVCAMQALHRIGIMYRSLHPEGIMIDSKGRLQLCDFGLAKADGVGGKSFTICGIANYLAPEMVFHQQPHNEAVDFWSLGVLLHELVCGDYPFAGQNEIATYSKIAAYAQCKDLKRRREMLPLQNETALEKAASPLVDALLNPEAGDRLGMPIKGSREKGEEALRAHPYFQTQKVDWSRVHSTNSPLMGRLVIEKDIVTKESAVETENLLELFFATKAPASKKKSPKKGVRGEKEAKHWLDDLA